LTKQELIKRVATRAKQPNKKQVAALVDAVFSELAEYFVEARTSRGATARFTYPGFGSFTKKKRGSRTFVNPWAQEAREKRLSKQRSNNRKRRQKRRRSKGR